MRDGVAAGPAEQASITLSVSSCRTRRPRPAPIASRVAISFCRAEARASSRLATFAQAVQSTRAATPSSIRKNTTIILRKPALTWPARST